MSDEVKKQFDAFYLFVRTDEKYEEVAAQVHDMRIAVEHIKNGQDKLEGRVNQGVAVTGRENAAALALMSVKQALLEQKLDRIEGQLFHEETGLFKQFKDVRDWVAMLNRTVVVFFITSVAGALILWAIKNFQRG